MENIIFAINGVAPIFLIIFLGLALKRLRFIDDNFIRISSKLVFSVALPALIFEELAATEFLQKFHLGQILFACSGIFIFYILIWLLARGLTSDGRDQGAFIQGSYRSNFAIVGLALIANFFDRSAVDKAAILLAFMMPLFNVLAVIALTYPLKKHQSVSLSKTVMNIITNPLILAMIASIPFSLLRIKIPVVMSTTIEYLSDLSFPLALIGIGASLDIKSIKNDFRLAAIASSIKIILLPLTLTVIAYQVGFRGEDIGVLFMLFATPTAIASYIMADSMGSNHRLAGSIIMLSTFGSILTISIGIFLLRYLHII
ncbi:AEC family transporter [candidate division KSB1 bacterium]|nr:AEC family transporter [candidate division KSB1 bacterium]